MHLLKRLRAAVRAFVDFHEPPPFAVRDWMNGLDFHESPDPLRFRMDERGNLEPVIAHKTIGSGDEDEEEERVHADMNAFHAARRTIHAAATPCHHGKLPGECCPACIALNRLS